MRIIHHDIEVKRRSDRVEIFPIGDTHIGKSNCAERPLRQQVQRILTRSNRDDRQVCVLFGGDICDYVKPGDIKRFNIDSLADWLVSGSPKQIRERLNDVSAHQLKRAIKIFDPIKHLAVGAIEGNHEYSIRHYNNFDMHGKFCGTLQTENLTDEAMIRFRFKKGRQISIMKLYLQHGNGGGRTRGAEPNHLGRLIDEWEDADVVMRGHSHTFQKLPPKSVLYIPNRGKLPTHLLERYRYALNWGCWLYSHTIGPSSYESRAAYPARAIVTSKIVVWPFWKHVQDGQEITRPKIEIREYPLL